MAEEKWRQVPDWPYEVSNLGRIRRTEPSQFATGRHRHTPDRIISPTPNREYLAVNLYRNGEMKRFTVHRLVCMAFHGPPGDGDTHVRHINGDPRDNRAANLSWGSPLDNEADKAQHGRRLSRDRNHQTKLTTKDVKLILDEYNKVMSGRQKRTPDGWYKRTASEFNVSINLIRHICRGHYGN